MNLYNSIVAQNGSTNDCTRSEGTITAQNSLIGDDLSCVKD